MKNVFPYGKRRSASNILYQNERPLSAKQRKTKNRTRVNGDPRFEFTVTDLTSYAGQGLLIRCFGSVD